MSDQLERADPIREPEATAQGTGPAADVDGADIKLPVPTGEAEVEVGATDVAADGTVEATSTEAEAPEAAAEVAEAEAPPAGAAVETTTVAEAAVEITPVAEAEVEVTPATPVTPEPTASPAPDAQPFTETAETAEALPAEAAAQPPIGTADAAALVPLEDIAPAIVGASLSRRAFLGFGLMLAGGVTGAAALSRLFPVFDDTADAASPIVPTYDPAGKAWTFVVDTASCIGCGLCVVACKEENHVAEEAAYTRTWIERHVTTADGAVFVDSPEAGMYGFPAESTAPGAAGKTVDASFFEPRLCMQCEDSPCTQVCPVGATYKTEDGVILVDASRCIGCGYCVVACPYGARYITPAGADNPNDMPGVADKCTWCYHRISRGAKPACVEVCPVGARQFGDASDPNSDIATLVRERAPQQLYPEYGTRPRVLYLGPAIEEA